LGNLVRTKPGSRIQLGSFWLVNLGENTFTVVTDEEQLADEIESLL